MTYWITTITSKNTSSSGIIGNKAASESAQELGFRPLFYTRFPRLREEGVSQRKERIDLILAGVKPHDIVMVQYPMWVGYANFEDEFINALKNIPGVKIAALVWDIVSWVGDSRKRDYSGDPSLWMLNKFDLVICANPKMASRLREEGAVMRPMLSWELSDLPYAGALPDLKFKKRLYYVATGIIPEMVADYTAKTPFYLIGPYQDITEKQTIRLLGQIPSLAIPLTFEGGFGVVEYSRGGRYKGMLRYGEYNNPMKLSMYLAAGLPPVVMSRSAHAGWIKKAGVGLVIDDLNEIDQALADLSEQEYQEMLEAIRPWQRAVSSGFFVKRACLETIRVLAFGLTDTLIKLD